MHSPRSQGRAAELESAADTQSACHSSVNPSEVAWTETLQTVDRGYVGAVGSVEQRNRVLRNTYWLLALSMVPTVLGAWIGVATGIDARDGAGIEPDRLPGRRLRLHVRDREDQELGRRRAGAAGVHLLHGPDAVAPDRRWCWAWPNGAGADHDGLRRHRRDLPRHGDAVDRSSSATCRRWASSCSSARSCCWWRGIANIFVQSSALMITLSVLAIGIFSAFILYDLKRVQRRPRDQLHQRHAGRLPEPLQRVPERCWRSSDLTGERRLSVAPLRMTNKGPSGPCSFMLQRRTTAMLSTCAVCGNMLTTPRRAAAVAGAGARAGRRRAPASPGCS